MDHLEAILKTIRPKARATLIRLLGDMDRAEEALQSACLRACEHWPQQFPDAPLAWLISTARNSYIDQYRKQQRESQWQFVGQSDSNSSSEQSDENDLHYVEDDTLRLIFTCCHPILNPESQIALTLRVILDLSVEEIARAFFTAPGTIEQRITRAKRKISDTNQPYSVPQKEDLSPRINAVLAVIYLIFNEGYLCTNDKQIVSGRLCQLAIRLGRLAARIFPTEPEVTGLLALMMLQHARLDARLTKNKTLITIENQDRKLWDKKLITEGTVMLQKALLQRKPGNYQLQASIAAIHTDAKEFRDTDWTQIEILYRLLEKTQPSPIVSLNRIVALSYSQGATKAWSLFKILEEKLNFESDNSLENSSSMHSVKAHLLEKMGELTQALSHYKKAKDKSSNLAERQYLNQKIDNLE